MFGSCPSQFLYLLPAPTVVVCVWAQLIRNFRRRETDPISMDNIFVVRNGSTGWRNDAERVPYICEECSGAEPHWVGKHDYRKKICIRGGVLTLGGFPLRHLLVFVVVDVVWRERVCWLHRIFSYYPIDFFLYFFFLVFRSLVRSVISQSTLTHTYLLSMRTPLLEWWRDDDYCRSWVRHVRCTQLQHYYPRTPSSSSVGTAIWRREETMAHVLSIYHWFLLLCTAHCRWWLECMAHDWIFASTSLYLFIARARMRKIPNDVHSIFSGWCVWPGWFCPVGIGAWQGHTQ